MHAHTLMQHSSLNSSENDQQRYPWVINRNVDAIGRWRDTDGKHKIDSSGTLPGDESFSSPIELIRILTKRQDRFCRSLSRKMLVYSLGRGLEFNDRCAIDRIVAACREDGFRFQAMVIAVVQSEPFRMRREEGVKP